MASKQAYENSAEPVFSTEYNEMAGLYEEKINYEYDPEKFNQYLNDVILLLKERTELDGYSNDALAEIGEYMIKNGIFGSLINNPEELAN